VSDLSSGETELVRRRPIDKAARSRSLRLLAPIWALLMLGNLILAIAVGEPVVSASIFFGGAVLLLLRIRWPMDTWPEWLFTYKP
jgi:hypothetical protein